MAPAALVFVIDAAQAARWPARWRGWQPNLLTAAVVTTASLCLLGCVGGTDARPFIYGRF